MALLNVSENIEIGVDADILSGVMTGIGNYCLNLLKAERQENPDYQFYGFSELRWRQLDLTEPVEITPVFSSMTTQKLAKAKSALRTSLAQVSAFRAGYRRLQAVRFRSPPSKLDIFHAFKYLPIVDLPIPTLPVVYDLSFVRFPELHPSARLRDLERLPDVVSAAPLVQTISQFSKAEIVELFGCAPEKIFVAPPAARAIFAPLGIDATSRAIAQLQLVFGKYFLTVGTLEPRKNLCTLIAAYAALDSKIQNKTPLVIVGFKGWGNLELPAVTDALISKGCIRFLQDISDRQLRDLYEGASALLYPSLYEGFGMPVVEALACGTRVAHSNNTSMDEIAPGVACSVPAKDVEGWIQIMKDFSEDIQGIELDRAKRMERARAFDWNASAKIVSEAYRRII